MSNEEKSEIRISKFETSSNRQKKEENSKQFGFDHFTFLKLEIASDFVFRISDF